MSLSLAVTRGLLRFRPRTTTTVEILRAAIADRKPEAAIPRSLARVARVRETLINGQPVVHLTPKRGVPSGHVIYTHGGCYVFPIIGAQWGIVANLIEQAGVSVTVPLYGLAPEHGVDEAYELLDRVYREAIVAHGQRIFLAGDSAGGGLALGQALRYRDADKVAPAGLLLLSPWVDVTMTNPAIPGLARRDPMLGAPGLVEAGKLWAGPRDPRDPLVSPLFGDLAGLPPVHIYQGDRDLLLADAKELARRIHAAGGEVELRITRGGFHVFPGAPWLPEAKRAVRRMAAVLADQGAA